MTYATALQTADMSVYSGTVLQTMARQLVKKEFNTEAV